MVSAILSNSVRIAGSLEIIGFDGQLLGLEMGGLEVLPIAHGLPAEEVLHAFRHVGNHFKQHDRFVEMI